VAFVHNMAIELAWHWMKSIHSYKRVALEDIPLLKVLYFNSDAISKCETGYKELNNLQNTVKPVYNGHPWEIAR